MPDELLDLADLAEVEINPLEKNQLGLLKGLLLVIKKSEKTVGELEKLQQNTPQGMRMKLLFLFEIGRIYQLFYTTLIPFLYQFFYTNSFH